MAEREGGSRPWPPGAAPRPAGGHLNVALLVNEKVLRLQVPVDEIEGVQVLEGQDDLGGIEAGMGLAGGIRGEGTGEWVATPNRTCPPPNSPAGGPTELPPAQLSKMRQRSSLLHTELQTGKSPDVYQQRNGVTDCDRVTQWNPT